MYVVTLPNGRTYTYGPSRATAARALAAKTGGTVTGPAAPAERCDCLRPSCYGCDDAHDARRDAMAERGTLRARRYVR